jgi:hypothetical protein
MRRATQSSRTSKTSRQVQRTVSFIDLSVWFEAGGRIGRSDSDIAIEVAFSRCSVCKSCSVIRFEGSVRERWSECGNGGRTLRDGRIGQYAILMWTAPWPSDDRA